MKRREFLAAVPVAAATLSVSDASAALREAGAEGSATNAAMLAAGPAARVAAMSDVAETALVPATEPGKPLVVAGTIFAADGKTPARGVRLFLYHTDAKGYYSQPVDNPRTARLRGWVTADAQGRYRFRTIRPAHYATGQRPPAHIHTHLHGPEMPAHWIDSFLFADDQQLNAAQRTEGERLGALSPVMQVEERGGVVYCTRDIRVEPRLFERNRLAESW